MIFNNDIDHSIAMQPFADEIYKSVLPIKHITRFTRDDDQINILDKEFHIDCILSLKNGQIITLQEKFLRSKFANFDCFTLEYYNNPLTHEIGEWYRLCTDLYFTGYGSPEEGFISAYLFKTIDVKLAILSGELKGILKKTSHSFANFYAFPFKDFKEEWFIYKKSLNFKNSAAENL